MTEAILDKIRKNCKLCNTYRLFKAQDKSYRLAVENGLEELQQAYTEKFEELRRKSGSTNESVKAAKDNKYFCMDLIPRCRQCDREDPLVANELKQMH